MNDLILLGCDFYSVVPILIYFSGIYFGFHFGILHETIPFLLFSFLNDQTTKFIKAIPYPEFMWDITRRPEGAFNTDYLSRNGLVRKDAPGFPSGHMTSISSLCFYMILRQKGDIPWEEFIRENMSLITFNIIVVLLMGFARWYKKCHNLFQITAGILYGTLTGYLYYEIIGKHLIK